MSSADKLRALEQRMETEEYDGPCRYMTHFDLINALPALIAVVEAAEAGRDEWERRFAEIAGWTGRSAWDKANATSESIALIDALATLDAALGGGE